MSCSCDFSHTNKSKTKIPLGSNLIERESECQTWTDRENNEGFILKATLVLLRVAVMLPAPKSKKYNPE